MLTIDYPQALSAIEDLNYGLLPFRHRAWGRYLLAVKLNKEALLAARLNRGFRVYLVPAGVRSTIGAICAFFDDDDEPQTVRIPFGEGDGMASDLIALFSQNAFDIHLFDENDRELMGYRATLPDRQRFVARTADLCLPMFDARDWRNTDKAMSVWFGLRTAEDDAAAFDIAFGQALFDDDRVIVEAHKPEIRGTLEPSHTSLIREEPGGFQERDIAHMLWRVFPQEAVIANPIRSDTGRELCDVLAVIDGAIVVVQAKDSPNTESSIRRSITRKATTSLGHVEKAADQMRGALAHIIGSQHLKVVLPDRPMTIPLEDVEVYGLIVLSEMFDDRFREYSAPVLRVAQATGARVVVLDLPQLHILTNRLRQPLDFLAAIARAFEMALTLGEFPRSQHTGPPLQR